jgi:hypothetical protein
VSVIPGKEMTWLRCGFPTSLALRRVPTADGKAGAASSGPGAAARRTAGEAVYAALRAVVES